MPRDLHLAIITRPDRNCVLLARTEGRVTAAPFLSSFCLFSLLPPQQMDKANERHTHLCWTEKETLPSRGTCENLTNQSGRLADFMLTGKVQYGEIQVKGCQEKIAFVFLIEGLEMAITT